MPNPRKAEKKEHYISRFMSSSEAIRDFPNQVQRYAVALSMWERRNKK